MDIHGGAHHAAAHHAAAHHAHQAALFTDHRQTYGTITLPDLGSFGRRPGGGGRGGRVVALVLLVIVALAVAVVGFELGYATWLAEVVHRLVGAV